MAAFYSRNTIIALPVLKLTNQNKRRYYFRFESVNQLVAFLTSVAPNWQRHSAKAGSLKQRQNTANFLQSRTKVVGTLELGHISPIPPNQCWKISRFFQQKEKKSPDYQHCKWGEGRACSLSQPFCPRLSKKRI